MSGIIAEYEKKQAELKALLEKAEIEITGEIMQYLKNLSETVAKMKAFKPSFNLDELAEWKQLIKISIPLKARMEAAFPKTVAPKAKSKGKGRGKKATDGLTPKEQEIADFIGKTGKTNAEINKHFKIANSSVNTSKMKAKGFIVKKDGKWLVK